MSSTSHVITISENGLIRSYKERSKVLQTQVLRVGQANEPCIGLIQKNLIENSVQDKLPYILKLDSLC